MFDHGKLGPLEWSLAGRALPEEDMSGDFGVALDLGNGALFGVIDGLGHGRGAYEAAHRAGEVLADNRAEPLDVLMLLCHHALAETRGAAMTLVTVDFGSGDLTWLGIGNVSTCLIEARPTGPTARASALLLGGIVGYRLPPALHPQSVPMRPGDLLLMVTDGILANHAEAVDLAKPTQRVTADVLTGHAKSIDDALVLAARHRGATP